MKKILIPILCILLATAMLLVSTGCVRASASELSAGYTRAVTGDAEMDDTFAANAANFAFALFRETLDGEKAQQLISPLSAMLCLALVANGADGNTLAEMEGAFGMDVDTLNESLYAYTKGLYSGENCKTSLANSIWFRDADYFAVREDFLQTNADWYGAQVYKAPFDASTQKDINDWVKRNTDGMIDSILDEPPSAATVMYLINTLVFDAKWQTKYEKSDIRDRIFTNGDGSRTTVDMMYSEESTLLTGEDFLGFAKNYEGNAYSFVGLLPDDENADILEFAASLTGEEWLKVWGNRRGAPVDVGIPEFSYDSYGSLVEALRAMGMEKMFSPMDADFSKMGSAGGANLFCSSVEQKTFIDVSRNGTKAAAVTWAGMECTSAAPMESYSVILDRPFVYAIVDNATGLPLFVGVINSMN